MLKLPHPIPYQGSKRNLAPLIAPYVPRGVETWFEPFAGSAAMTLWASHNKVARRYVIGDVLEPIVQLWEAIVERPERTTRAYAETWGKQLSQDAAYFNRVRDRYNAGRDPVDLLYLICRCVKNAVRFNKKGHFTQSADKRRLGMQPQKMALAIEGASWLLRGRTRFVVGDWMRTVADAASCDFVYLDPPFLGTTIGKDKRYVEGLQQNRLISGLEGLLARRLPFALSYDGMTGAKEYGPPLPENLGLVRLLLHAGKSSQATLVGRSEETVESLYLSPGLGDPVEGVIRRKRADQASFAF